MAGKQVDFALGGLQDSSGNPLSGGTVSFYTTGGLVAKDMYSDIALSTNIGNVVTLDAYGMVKVYSDGTVTLRAIVKDSAGTTIKDIDGVAYVEDVTSSTFTTITLNNSSPSNADGGRNSTLTATGLKADSTSHSLVSFDFEHDGTGNDTKGRFSVNVNNGTALTEYFEIDSDGTTDITGNTTITGTATVTGTTTLAATNITGAVGVTGVVTIIASEPTGEVINANSSLVLKDSGTNFLQFAADTGATTEQGILFGDDDDDNGVISYTHHATSPFMKFVVEASEFMRIKDSGLAIGATTARGKIDITTSAQSIPTPYSGGDEIVLENSAGNAGITIGTAAGATGGIYFSDLVSSVAGQFLYDHSTDLMSFYCNGGHVFSLTPTKAAVGISAASADGTMHIHTASAGTVTANTNSDDLVIENSGNAGLSIITDSSNNSNIYFGNQSNNQAGKITFTHSTSSYSISTPSGSRFFLTDSGFLGINESSPEDYLHITATGASSNTYHASAKLLIEDATAESYIQFSNSTGSSTKNGILFGDDDSDIGGFTYTHGSNIAQIRANNLNFVTVDGGNSKVGIGTESPQSTFHVQTSSSLGDVSGSSNILLESSGGNSYFQFTTAAASKIQGVLFGDAAASNAGFIEYAHATDQMTIGTNATSRLYLDTKLGVGAAASEATFEVTTSSLSIGSGANAAADDFIIRNSGNSGMTIAGGSTSTCSLHFADSTAGGNDIGAVIYDHNTDKMRIRAGDADIITASSTKVGILESSPDCALHITTSASGTSAHGSAVIALEADASTSQYIQFMNATSATASAGVLFGDANDIDVGSITYDHSLDKMVFVAGATGIMVATSTGVMINNGTGGPATNCALDITSGTSKGVKLPQVSGTGSISGPTAAILIYDSGVGKLKFYNGSGWETVTSA